MILPLNSESGVANSKFTMPLDRYSILPSIFIVVLDPMGFISIVVPTLARTAYLSDLIDKISDA